MESIQEYLRARGIEETDLILDGTMQSIKTENFKGWYIGDDLGSGKRRITIEDWRTRDRQTISEGIDESDPEEKQKLAASRQKFEDEKLHLQKQKKKESEIAIREFRNLSSTWNKHSGYLSKKGISTAFGAIQIQSNTIGTDLIIPMLDRDGVVWNYQTIDESGFKAFQPGALADGLFFELNYSELLDEKAVILICEGFATSCSVQMAIPTARVICAFSSGNLPAVAEIMRSLHNYARIVVCADDDWKVSPNAGLVAAEEAAKIANCSTVSPVFSTIRGKAWTDWNDMHMATQYGLETVRKQIEKAISTSKAPSSDWTTSMQQAEIEKQKPTKQAQKNAEKMIQFADSGVAITPYINGVAPMPMRTNKQGQPILPTEFECAAALMKYYEGRCTISEGSIFVYTQNHWKEVDDAAEANLMVQIQVLYNGLATNSRIKATFEQFQNIVPRSQKNLFIPDPAIVNFQNGTLHIERKKSKWEFRFAAHAKENYCTQVIPINYDETRKIKNQEFEDMITRICGDTPDGLDKVKAVRQMYGACIAPIFPHLFMLHGPAASGKTSLIIPAMRLVHKDNWSSVEPHEFEGSFGMESMAGKLVNIVTDIDLTKNISDNHIKKIEDRIPVRIDRKFKNAVLAPMPSVHIFGGNDIPPTYEKGSGAHERRWTFLHIQGMKISGNYSKSFANDVFDACPEGVLNFALRGLGEVLEQNGHYFVPESGKEKMKRWQMEHDPVAQFMNEIFEGGDGKLVGWELAPEGRVLRSLVWTTFCQWYEEAYNRKPKIGKNKFYEAILKVQSSLSGGSNIALKISDGARYFTGIKTGPKVDEEDKH